LKNETIGVDFNSIQTKKSYSKRKSIKLQCHPFGNQTQYDYLAGIFHRARTKGIPEPDLIHIFDRSGQLSLSELRQQLNKMKEKNVIF
jgi:hypothetical protein